MFGNEHFPGNISNLFGKFAPVCTFASSRLARASAPSMITSGVPNWEAIRILVKSTELHSATQ